MAATPAGQGSNGSVTGVLVLAPTMVWSSSPLVHTNAAAAATHAAMPIPSPQQTAPRRGGTHGRAQ